MKKRKLFLTLSVLLVTLYIIWWFALQILAPAHDSVFNDYYADTYGILAGVGGLMGLYIAGKWGYFKSYIGNALIFLSLGLIAQFFGQLSYTILFYVYDMENAYPAFGEIFYLASIPLYIIGLWFTGKAAGMKFSFNRMRYKLIAFLIPLLMLATTYFIFLRSYDPVEVPLSIVVLDYVYPLGQALFVSTALVILFSTKNLLGGLMKSRVLFILFSLLFQYIADSLFIYETRTEIWYAGGLSDLMFVLSYFLMAVALIQFEGVEEDLNTTVVEPQKVTQKLVDAHEVNPSIQ
jgi:hypothetical protein